jgi:hypothetical protein
LALKWNDEIIDRAIAEDGLLTLKGVRTAALVHLAMHDALNAIVAEYDVYGLDTTANQAHPLAAASQAAFEIAVSQFPNLTTDFETILHSAIDSIGAKAEVEAGIGLGKAVAQTLLELRAQDRWNAEADYTWHPMAPGVYAEFHEHSGTPEGFIFGSGWAAAQPFMLDSASHFRVPPPPEINSEDYREAYEEVKSYGATNSTSRSNDQAHLAMWWKDFVENSHNRLARQVIVTEQLNLWEATRVLALMNMAVYDAYINVFDNKFHYNHWRPYTAIRWAHNDGNASTQPDPNWNNLHRHTYAFPSYPSAHGTASAAAMSILTHTISDSYPFTMTTVSVDSAGPFSGKMIMDPPTRSFNSFADAAYECALSRIYLGIHFRYDSEEGYKLGTRVGDYGFENFLQPK